MKKILLSAMLLLAALAARPQFVQVADGHFVRNGLPYVVNGTNMWYAAVTDSARLCRELDALCALGINNLRVMASAEGQPVIAQADVVAQTAPGVYNERLLRGLDRMLVELSRRDMTCVLFLTNAWEWSGGYGSYLEWSGCGTTPSEYGKYCLFCSQFHSNEKAKAMYRDHVRRIVGRTNTISGTPYRDEPAIMAWQLCNEPRAFDRNANTDFRKWVAESAALVKSIDNNHMLSTGSEGSVGCQYAPDPMADYEQMHADANIDYLTIHVWPTMWGWASKTEIKRDLQIAKQKTADYIKNHIAVAERLHKPVVLEEFGYPRDSFGDVSSRDEYYRLVYDLCRQTDGQNFWAWGGEAVPAKYLSMWKKGEPFGGDPTHEPQGLFSVYKGDSSTIDIFRSERPAVNRRRFVSPAVERKIAEMRSKLPTQELWQLFQNCLPNTLDSAVLYEVGADGLDDTFVLTGDIEAMWLRDSGAQVWPYVALMSGDDALRHLVRGVINRQLKCLLIDPYANAFNHTPQKSEWHTDFTAMTDDLHERKWELDSPCYVLRLVHGYWLQTGDDALVNSNLFIDALDAVLAVFAEQQKWNGQKTSYRFGRTTHAMHDTTSNYGYGHPVKPCGLISSMFRPSDDCTLFQFLVPSNFMAADVLRKTAAMPIPQTVKERCLAMAQQVENALRKYAVVHTEKYGDVYAYEVDGFGSALLQDDANVPSLLSLPYLTSMPVDDPVYQNTRRMILSEDNPYFFSGTAGSGIGSQHTTLDNIWPMSLIMQAMTSTDCAETGRCLDALVRTTGGTHLMHESFHKDNAHKYTRSWFAWANTLLGELLLRLYE